MPLNRNGSTAPATYSALKVGGNSPTGSVSSDTLTVPGFSDRPDPAVTCDCLAIWVSIVAVRVPSQIRHISAGMPQTPCGGGCIAPPISPCPSASHGVAAGAVSPGPVDYANGLVDNN